MKTNELVRKISLFPYLAELILEELIRQNRDARRLMLRELGYAEDNDVGVFLQQRVYFNPSSTKVTFDGEHRVDLCLLVSGKDAIPIEVKAGSVVRSVVSGRFSHGDRRIAGNMLGILDRQLPDDLRHLDLFVRLNDVEYPLSRKWGVIAPASMIERWKSLSSFVSQPILIDINQLCSKAGPDAFNAAAKKVLHSEDYFVDWVQSGP